MSDSEDVASAAVAIIIAVAASQQNRCRRRPRRFWIRQKKSIVLKSL